MDRFREDPVFVNEVKSPKGAVGLPQNSHVPVVQSLLGSLGTMLVFFLRLGVYCYLKLRITSDAEETCAQHLLLI